ncbi:uncharacterized protein LOC121949540 isoform X2 [Plectropomus leopardus]|uniref:uncharacterized protein LOC121949540 isoform X2 n=1 Tax=Plectropomus leopardus TaxID=160734 RepID=UPI001C4AA915|nr:uncharacterized protein LOC121949540 isoform X2 [Plectropomus leopardus]
MGHQTAVIQAAHSRVPPVQTPGQPPSHPSATPIPNRVPPPTPGPPSLTRTGHRAVGCLKRARQQVNGIRSLLRAFHSSSPTHLPQLLVGANVLQAMIDGQESLADAQGLVTRLLLRKALGVKEEQAEAMVNYIQIQKKPNYSMSTIRVGKEDMSIPAGKTMHVQCRVPPMFDMSDPVVLYEPSEENMTLQQLSVGEGILETSSRWPLITMPISNHTKQNTILPKRTALGSIQHTAKVIEMGKTETQWVETSQLTTVRADVNNVTTPSTTPTESRLSLGGALMKSLQCLLVTAATMGVSLPSRCQLGSRMTSPFRKLMLLFPSRCTGK